MAVADVVAAWGHVESTFHPLGKLIVIVGELKYAPPATQNSYIATGRCNPVRMV
jgi:hypothetical protein